ncbi:hypothetical protein BH11ACT8_BH11ACT8_31220 [soil metagenome]
MRRPSMRAWCGAATVVPVVGIVLSLRSHPENAAVHAANLVAVAIAWVIVRRVPTSSVGPALAWCGACISLSLVNDVLAESWYTSDALPLAGLSRHVWAGLWPINLAGLLVLLLVFPDGRRPGRFWAGLPGAYAAALALMVFSMWDVRQVGGGLDGEQSSAQHVAGAVGSLLVAVCLVGAVASVVRQYRTGDERRALQIRWLLLAGSTAVLLLAGGWAAEAFGASIEVAYTPFVLAIALLMPAAVGIAMVRHDLFDVDRLLSTGTSWLLTLVAAAALYAGVVVVVSRSVDDYVGLGPAAAAFVTALVLLPLHRFVVTFVGRLVDRDRHVAVTRVERFAADVRSGERAPEDVEQVLREAQGDPELALVLRHPDGRWIRPDGDEVAAPDGLAIDVAGDTIAVVTVGRDTARARGRLADLTRAAWVTIEVSRLRLVLREALSEVVASQARLSEAGVSERRRLERDLHDGAQQRIVATGMRLRVLQRHLSGSAADEIESAVAELEQTVRDLRDLAHGVRPMRLSDGLGAALEAVRTTSPVPLTLSVVEPSDLDESRRLTAYLFVSEAVTNALKHAAATSIEVCVADDRGRVAINVTDDGRGGAPESGLTSLRDRARAVGGQMTVTSPVGGGTTVTALL